MVCQSLVTEFNIKCSSHDFLISWTHIVPHCFPIRCKWYIFWLVGVTLNAHHRTYTLLAPAISTLIIAFHIYIYNSLGHKLMNSQWLQTVFRSPKMVYIDAPHLTFTKSIISMSFTSLHMIYWDAHNKTAFKSLILVSGLTPLLHLFQVSIHISKHFL